MAAVWRYEAEEERRVMEGSKILEVFGVGWRTSYFESLEDYFLLYCDYFLELYYDTYAIIYTLW